MEHISLLIFFVYPGPMGCEENQFTPLGVWGKEIDFQAISQFVFVIPDTHNI
jgi:hypothetical protein